jgi:hypothetical protein
MHKEFTPSYYFILKIYAKEQEQNGRTSYLMFLNNAFRLLLYEVKMLVLLLINFLWTKYGESIMGTSLMKVNQMWIKFTS